MDCHEFLHRYSEYDDSLIPAREADPFRAHLAECPSCARYDRVLRKGRMVARQLAKPEPSPDFGLQLRLRLLQRRSRGRASHIPGRLAPAVAAATVLVVTASALPLMDSGSVPSTATEPGTTPTAVAAPESGRESASRPAPSELPPTLDRIVQVAVRELPATRSGMHRAWPVEEVAPAAAAAYSPLVTGPPAYRSGSPSTPTIDFDRRTLD